MKRKMLFRQAKTLFEKSSRLFCTVLLLGIAAAAQNDKLSQNQQTRKAEQGAQNGVLRIDTELVQIDLVVTDQHGKPVPDLRREDFELFEDGKKQTLTHFAIGTSKQPARWMTAEKKLSAISNEVSSANSVNGIIADQRPGQNFEAGGRFIVLAVDDYHLSPANLIYVKRTLNKFVSEQMVAGDQIAIVSTSGNVGLFQQFTGERQMLERAINRLSVQEKKLENANSIPRITEYQAELIEFGDRDAIELAITDIMRFEAADQAGQGGASGPSGGGNSPPRQGGGRGGQSTQSQSGQNVPSQREILEYRVRMQARMVMAMNGNYTQATLSTLESVIRNLRPLTGRKILVLLSDGFFLSGTGVYSKLYDLRRITDAATRSGVVIYSIDARGLVTITPGGDASERVEFDPSVANAQSRIQMATINAKRDGLFALAAETGGTLFFNSNDLNLGLQRVMNANETYYVLAYEPAESRRDGRFHKIEVRVADHPELKVRTRSGYFAPDEKAEKAERKAEEKRLEQLKNLPPEKITTELKAEKDKKMMAGIGALFPLREIPIEMAVDFVEMAGFSGAIVNTHVNAASLNFIEVNGRQQSVVEIAGYLFDERGKIANSFNEQININARPETLEQIKRQGFNYRRLVELKPGFYQARIAVREEKSGRLGSANEWIEIPDVKNQKLALSGVMLTEAGGAALQDLAGAGTANQNGSYTPRPSSASRRFKSGGDLDLLLFVYNAKADQNAVDLAVQTQIFSGSKQVFATPLMKIAVATDTDLQRIPFAARIPLKSLAAGNYELRLMVIDRLTKTSALRQVNFSVE